MQMIQRIFKRIDELNMTQKEFCERTGIGQSTVSEWKSKKTNPTAEKIMPICNALDVTPEWLLSGVSARGTRSNPADYYVISKDSDIGMLIDRIDALPSASRDRLLGYLSALEEQ